MWVIIGPVYLDLRRRNTFADVISYQEHATLPAFPYLCGRESKSRELRRCCGFNASCY